MGALLPCGEGKAPQGSVIILSAEDGDADTIVPRLHAAGADLGRVHITKMVTTDDDGGRRGFSLQTDIGALERLIEEKRDVLLVIIDPISSYFGRGVDSHKNTDVRGVLAPLTEMAERTGVALVSVTAFQQGLRWQRAEGGPSFYWQHRLCRCAEDRLCGPPRWRQ